MRKKEMSLRAKELSSSINSLAKKYKIKPEEIILRADGRIEWLCPHGCGHTISVPKQYENSKAWWVHGCDGCCSKMREIDEKIEKNVDAIMEKRRLIELGWKGARRGRFSC